MVRPTKFEVTQTTVGSTMHIAVDGELDLSTVETLARQVRESLNQTITALTLDLGELSFMDSSSLLRRPAAISERLLLRALTGPKEQWDHG